MTVGQLPGVVKPAVFRLRVGRPEGLRYIGTNNSLEDAGRQAEEAAVAGGRCSDPARRLAGEPGERFQVDDDGIPLHTPRPCADDAAVDDDDRAGDTVARRGGVLRVERGAAVDVGDGVLV